MSTLKIVMNGFKPHSGGRSATDKLIVPYGVGWAAFWRLSRQLAATDVAQVLQSLALRIRPPVRPRAAVSIEPDLLIVTIA